MSKRNNLEKLSGRVDSGYVAWGIVLVTLFTASIYIILKGPELGNDSYSYIQMYVSRPPGYPLFLLFLKIFGDHYLIVTVVVQTVLNATVFLIFINYISKAFKIRIMHILFLLPLIVYFFVWIIEPQQILTESIAFPLFLFLSVYLIDGLIRKDLKSLIIVVMLNTVLTLVRGQFLFLFPLVIMAGIYVFFRNKRYLNTKSILTFSFAIAISICSYLLINKVYHYLVHDTFTDTQTHMSFIRTAFYISDEDDYRLFEDEVLREIHHEMYDSLYNAGYSEDAFYDKINPEIPKDERRRSDLIQHRHEKLLLMESILRSDIIRGKYEDLEGEEFLVERDKIFKKISWVLITEHISFYIYVTLGEVFWYGFHGDRIFLLLFFLLYVISFFGLIRENNFGEVIFFLSTGHLGNLLLIAMANRVLGRYSMYTHFLILSILLVLFIKLILEKNEKQLQPVAD